MTPENPHTFEGLTEQELKDRYWATKRLLRWWEQELRDFDKDMNIGRSMLPSSMRGAYPQFKQHRDLIEQFIPNLEHQLSIIEQKLPDNPERQELIDREPERRRPGNFIKIEIDLQDKEPDFVVNFIHGEPCSVEQVPIVAERLIQYLIIHQDPFKGMLEG